MQQSRHHLVAVHDSANYAKGQKITEADEVEMLLREPHHAQHFVKIANPDYVEEQAETTAEHPADE